MRGLCFLSCSSGEALLQPQLAANKLQPHMASRLIPSRLVNLMSSQSQPLTPPQPPPIPPDGTHGTSPHATVLLSLSVEGWHMNRGRGGMRGLAKAGSPPEEEGLAGCRPNLVPGGHQHMAMSSSQTPVGRSRSESKSKWLGERLECTGTSCHHRHLQQMV